MSIWSLLESAQREHAHSEALVEQELSLTYAQTARRAQALAAHLRASGVRPGERIAILDDNSIPYFETYFAAAAIGAVLCPLNTKLVASELRAIFEDARPRGLLLRTELGQEALAAFDDTPGLEWLIAIGPASSRADAVRYEDIVHGAQEEQPEAGSFQPAQVGPDDLAQLYYTSGTTGHPKGVMLTHRNVCTHARAAVEELELSRSDTWGHIAPMFHLADAWATFALTLVGGRHHFTPRFEARTVLADMEGAAVTITNLVPTMLQRLVAELEERPRNLPALRSILSGGAPIAPDVVRRIIAAFRCEYVQTYGMTETSPYLTLSLLNEHLKSLGAEEQLRYRAKTGRPFQAVELQVVDSADHPVPADESTVGEIRVRGATVSPGYWNKPEETAAAFRGGWLYTGDLAVIDTEGFVDIVDRKKDMIVTGGENVYSIEVEHALHEHADILEAAVYGLPHPDWGEEVRAAVVLRSGAKADANELLTHCQERLARFKCPRILKIVAALPKTGSGKIQKSELRRTATL